LEWTKDPKPRDPVTNDAIYTSFAKPASGCPKSGTPVVTGTVANMDIRYVRVRTTVSYRPLLAFVLGQGSISAPGSGAARITGARPGPPGPTWPLMRHFEPSDFDTNCGVACNPDNADPVIFWAPNDDDLVYGSAKGLMDYSRYSIQAQLAAPPAERDTCNRDPLNPAQTAACVPQLITQWDQEDRCRASPRSLTTPAHPPRRRDNG